ncbi:MAG: DUF3404 domain-containing protein [Proteobacteria bacterium]|nr:DUF3404 domain-containing protein [Pseudomonadota bacterium]
MEKKRSHLVCVKIFVSPRAYWSVSTLFLVLTILLGFLAFKTWRRSDRALTAPREALWNILLDKQASVLLSLDDWPQELIDPMTIYPSSLVHMTKPLQELYRYSKDCRSKPSLEAWNDPNLSKAYLWHRYLCLDVERLPDNFVEKAPFMHPAGVSFAKLIFNRQKSDTQEIQIPLSRYHFRELNDLPASFFKSSNELRLRQLSLDAKQTYIHFEGTSFTENFIVIPIYDQESDTKIYSVNISQWQRYWSNLGVTTVKRKSGDICKTSLYSICFEASNKAYVYLTYMGLSLVGLLIFTLISRYLLGRITAENQRHDDENQRRMLSVLTHELRTPATVLKMEAESLRGILNERDESTQDCILRVMSSTNRLTKIVKSSENYLRFLRTSEKESAEFCSTVNLRDVIDEIRLDYAIIEFIDSPDQDIFVKGHQVWIEQCLRNVLENSLIHGTPPIALTLIADQNEVTLEVKDSGSWKASPIVKDSDSMLDSATSYQVAPFQKSEGSIGMGLGLFVTNEFMRLMEGTLQIDSSSSCVRMIWRRIHG